MITPAQCRAARAMLEWSQQALADASKVGNATIRNFEAGRSSPQNATLSVLKRTFEESGVIFIEQNGEGAGVRLRKFRLGDCVRPRPGTALWDGSKPLHERWGKVVDLPSDGTTVTRITVSMQNDRQLVGVDAGMFELVPPHER